MGEIFRENKKFIMERRKERADRFIPLLKKLGAEEKLPEFIKWANIFVIRQKVLLCTERLTKTGLAKVLR